MPKSEDQINLESNGEEDADPQLPHATRAVDNDAFPCSHLVIAVVQRVEHLFPRREWVAFGDTGRDYFSYLGVLAMTFNHFLAERHVRKFGCGNHGVTRHPYRKDAWGEKVCDAFGIH